MSRRPAAWALSLSVALATFFALLSWSGLAVDSSAYLVPLFFLAVGTGLTGALLRHLRLPLPLVVGGQLVVILVALTARWAAPAAWFGFVPSPEALAEVARTVGAGVTAANEWAAPVPAEATDFAPLLVAVGVVVILLVDAIACSLGRVALAGLPLLAVMTAPVSIVDSVSWVTFAAASAAYVASLALDQAARLGRWGTTLLSRQPVGSVRDNQPHRVTMTTLLPAATRLGVLGIGIAVLVPVVLPDSDGLLSGGDGPGSGRGGDGVTLTNPLVDMRRDLTQGPDRPLVTVRTNEPDPAYLRMTVLDAFDGEAWRPAERAIPDSQRVTGLMPPPAGLLDAVERDRYSADISVSEAFATRWLPLPYPVTEVQVAGDWRYDLDTLDVVSALRGQNAAGLDYSVRTLKVQPTAGQLAVATPAPRSIQADNTLLPPDTPRFLRTLAVDVTAGEETPYEKAAQLQRWFQSEGGFEYSTDRAPGSGYDALEQFLGDGPGSRIGYCEQFASAMAMMARALGIPARVAVGFLEPEEISPGVFEYSTRDLHAWTEVFFTGAGWVRFEPTPTLASELPSYTTQEVVLPDASEAPSPTGTLDAPDTAPEPTQEDADAAASSDSTSAAGLVAIGVTVLLLVGLAAAAPRALRQVQRRRRLEGDATERVEGVWAEVRATALDLGVAWDDHATLRRRAVVLARSLGGDRAAVAALESLVLLVERARYSRSGADETVAERAGAHGSVVGSALWEAARPGARRRARWLPASVWRSERRVAGRAEAPAQDVVEGQTDRVSV